jgi:alpha-tubulin suppressor-like RCC1 family protein
VSIFPGSITLLASQQASVVLKTAGVACAPNTPVFCVDVRGRVFEYSLQNVPAGVSYTLDTTLRTPDTPGLVRVTFSAAADAAPVGADVAVHATVDGHTLGIVTLPVTVMPSMLTRTAPPVSVAAGASFSIAALADGTVRTWGENSDGQLGIGHRARSALPASVPGLVNVSNVAAGANHSLALTGDGRVWAWGGNDTGQLGQSPGTLGGSITMPALVLGVTHVRTIAAGQFHSLALDQHGDVWTWGNYSAGASFADAPPVRVANLPVIRAIAATSRQSFAVDVDGGVWRWGFVETPPVQPQQVAGLSGIEMIAASGDTQLALDANGDVWSWGANALALLGDGTSVERRDQPARIAGLTDVVSIDIGSELALAMTRDGRVWEWPAFRIPPVDPSAPPRSSTPGLVGVTGVRGIAAGGSHALALLDCGAVWSWGADSHGQLGDGVPTESIFEPPQTVRDIGDDSGCARVAFRAFHAGEHPIAGETLHVQPGPWLSQDPQYLSMFDRGSTVTVTADARIDSGVQLGEQQWTFDHWELDCAGTNPTISLRLDRSKTCAAVYRETTLASFVLTVLTDGGRITSTEGGIGGPESLDCSGHCSAVFRANTVVQLTAHQDTGLGLVQWELDCSGTTPAIEVTMDRPRTCRAHFRPFDLTIAVAGSGTVAIDDLAEDCAGTCTYQPRRGLSSLTAMPASAWRFNGWGGDCTGSSLTTTIAMSADRRCTAAFSRDPNSFFLTTIVEGSGTVRSVPAGVDCSATCVQLFPAGTGFDLAALASSGWMVSGWLDDCTTGAVPINHIVLDRDKTCRVGFVSQGAIPIAVMSSSPVSPRVGEITTFLGNDSNMFDPATNVHDLTGIKEWSWDFNGDGIFEVIGERFVADVVHRAFQTAGTFEVRLRVAAEDPTITDDEFQFITVQPAAGTLAGLTVNKAGDGRGRVVSRPPGLVDCGGSCGSAGPLMLAPQSEIRLVAEPLPGFVLTSWSGCDVVNTTTCFVVVGGDRTVTARFDPAVVTYTLTVAVTAPPGSNGVIVGSSPAGNTISCPAGGGPGSVCSLAFAAGSAVQVRPAGFENGAQFGNWSGCDTETGASRCNVILNGNRTVTATFVQ